MSQFKQILRSRKRKFTWFYNGYRIDKNSRGHYVVVGYSYKLKEASICGFFPSLELAKHAIDTHGLDDAGVF